MEDLLENNARSLAALLTEHKAVNVTLLDVRPLNVWTDFFIIATASSSAAMSGLERHIREAAPTLNLTVSTIRHKSVRDDEWKILDMGSIVIHLMSERARAFYELEKLWGDGAITR
jgi:ribosome-associated protein